MLIVRSLSAMALAMGLSLPVACGTSSPAGQPSSSTSASGTPTPAGSGTPSTGNGQSPSSAAPTAAAPSISRACTAAGVYLTAVRTGQHAGYDRVVFEFSGGHPSYAASVVKAVYSDAKGDVVPLAGQSLLRVVFHGATAWCPQSAKRTYTGASVLTPYYPRLLVVSAAGDFEQVLSFGVGLAVAGPYRVYALSGPDRVVLDVSHVAMGKFPGIWDITTWQQYWQRQYAWLNGHQPWLSNPAMVVEAWARSQWHTAPEVHQVNANTFHVTEPSGRVDTVTGTRPVTVPGPWVITKISYGAAHAGS